MNAPSSVLCAAAALLVAAGCGPRALDPPAAPTTTGGSSNPEAIAATLRAVAGPDALMIVGINAGAVTGTRDGSARVLEQKPDLLAAAAMAVGMPVCSVEFQKLATPSVAGDLEAMTIDDALDLCRHDDLEEMLARLGALETPSTVVVIAANTAITVRTTNNGINYFYDADIVRLLRAARRLYVPVCVIAPDALGIPTFPEGSSPGLAVDEALLRCGR